MDIAELLAIAAAKADALAGLVDALEYGDTRVLRINGIDHIFTEGFDVTVNASGAVQSRGYVVSSTARDLAHDVIRAARAH